MPSGEKIKIIREGYPEVEIALEEWAKITGAAWSYFTSPATGGAEPHVQNRAILFVLDYIDTKLGA